MERQSDSLSHNRAGTDCGIDNILSDSQSSDCTLNLPQVLLGQGVPDHNAVVWSTENKRSKNKSEKKNVIFTL